MGISDKGQRNVILEPFIWLPDQSLEDEIACSWFYGFAVLLQAFVKHKGVCSEHCRVRTCFQWDTYLQFAAALRPDWFPVFIWHFWLWMARCAAPLSLSICPCAEEQQDTLWRSLNLKVKVGCKLLLLTLLLGLTERVTYESWQIVFIFSQRMYSCS